MEVSVTHAVHAHFDRPTSTDGLKLTLPKFMPCTVMGWFPVATELNPVPHVIIGASNVINFLAASVLLSTWYVSPFAFTTTEIEPPKSLYDAMF